MKKRRRPAGGQPGFQKTAGKLAAVIGIGLLLAVMAACRSGENVSCGAGKSEAGETGRTGAERGGAEEEQSGPVTLSTVSMFAGMDANAETYRAINREFMDSYSYITVEDDSSPSGEEWKNKIAADFAVGNEPDVLQFFTDSNAADVLAADKFVTVEEIRELYPEYAADTLDQALDEAASVDGIHYAVPTTGYWEGLYCNRDLFDQYNLELPRTWEEFLEAVRGFREAGITPVAVSLSEVPHYWIDNLTLSMTGVEEYLFPPENGEVPAGFEAALDVLTGLREMGAFPEDTDTISNVDAGEMFREKRAAMMLDGSWSLSTIPDQDNTVVLALPRVEGGMAPLKAMVGGMSSGFYITKIAWENPAKRDAAVKFVMAHTGAEAVAKYWSGIGRAACKLEIPRNLTPLERSAIEYYLSGSVAAPSLDARMGGKPYGELIRYIPEVTAGKMDAEEAWSRAFLVYGKRRRKE